MNHSELPIPPGVAKEPISLEMLRVWVGSEDFLISLRANHWEQPDQWGDLLASVAHHLAKSWAKKYKTSVGPILEQIRLGIDEHWPDES